MTNDPSLKEWELKERELELQRYELDLRDRQHARDWDKKIEAKKAARLVLISFIVLVGFAVWCIYRFFLSCQCV